MEIFMPCQLKSENLNREKKGYVNRDTDPLFCAQGKITRVITKNINICSLHLGKKRRWRIHHKMMMYFTAY